jgi:hypothetical protein
MVKLNIIGDDSFDDDYIDNEMENINLDMSCKASPNVESAMEVNIPASDVPTIDDIARSVTPIPTNTIRGQSVALKAEIIVKSARSSVVRKNIR